MTRPSIDAIKHQLLAAGAYLGGSGSLDEVTITNAARQASIPISRAHQLFASDADFQGQVHQYALSRFHNYVQLTPDGSPRQLIHELVSYCFHFTSAEPYTYRYLVKLAPRDEGPLVFTRSFDELLREQQIPHWSIKLRFMYIAINGLAHLSVFGVARQLLPAVKMRLFRQLADILADCLFMDELESFEPHAFAGDHIPPVPADQLPTTTDAEVRLALVRGAVESVKKYSGEEISLSEAASEAGVSLSRAYGLIDGDSAFHTIITQQLKIDVTNSVLQQIATLADDASAVSQLKAIAIGYVGFAINDPAGFAALTTLSNTPIVPSDYVSRGLASRSGDPYGLLLEATDLVTKESGKQANPLSLFESGFMLWAVGHGLADILSNGYLSALPEDKRFDIVSEIIDVTINWYLKNS